MRFYKKRQAEMLNAVSLFLQKEQGNLAKKVPALGNFISEFIEKEKALYAIQMGNPNAVKMNTLQKQSVRDAFVKAAGKLIAVLKASNYNVKNTPLKEMSYTPGNLKKLTAENLTKAFLNAFNAAKKIKNLQYYGLSAEDMRDMQAYYKEFAVVKNAPAAKKKEVALRNKQLNNGVKDCISFLKNNIDSLMLIAAEDNAALSYNYKAVRQVLSKGQGRYSDAEVAYKKSRKRKKTADGQNQD